MCSWSLPFPLSTLHLLTNGRRALGPIEGGHRRGVWRRTRSARASTSAFERAVTQLSAGGRSDRVELDELDLAAGGRIAGRSTVGPLLLDRRRIAVHAEKERLDHDRAACRAAKEGCRDLLKPDRRADDQAVVLPCRRRAWPKSARRWRRAFSVPAERRAVNMLALVIRHQLDVVELMAAADLGSRRRRRRQQLR